MKYDTAFKDVYLSPVGAPAFCYRTGLTVYEETFRDGRLVTAVTRGDGQKGDDVTGNILTIPTVPRQLPAGADYPDDFEIRGEVLMPRDVFQALNEERIRQEETPCFLVGGAA